MQDSTFLWSEHTQQASKKIEWGETDQQKKRRKEVARIMGMRHDNGHCQQRARMMHVRGLYL